MKVTVLKEFPYAHDGNQSALLTVGPDREVRDELVSGLVAAGYIEKPEEQKALPGMTMPVGETGGPENKALDPPQDNKSATDTHPSRNRRRR